MPRLLPNTCRAVFATAFLLTGIVVSHAGVGLPATALETDPFRHVQALQTSQRPTEATARLVPRAMIDPPSMWPSSFAPLAIRCGLRSSPSRFSRSAILRSSSPGAEGPDPVTAPRVALRTLMNSGSGAVTAPVQSVDLGLENEPLQASTSGCEREDFVGFTAGNIALVRRGTCPFQAKAEQAKAAGAAGLIIMNQGTGDQTGIFGGRLETLATIPVLGVTTEVGRQLAQASRDPARNRVRLAVEVETGTRSTRNVIAEAVPERLALLSSSAPILTACPKGPA